MILFIIWLVGAICDRIWFALDNSVPAWDQADYLTGTLNYWQALQNPQWWDGEWWQSFWLLSSKIPPLTYIATAVVQHIFGTGPDQATLVMLLFSAILLVSVYGLGTVLFSESVGLWAAALCQILPGLYRLRLDFLLDYPLAAVVTLSFFCLTVWRVRGEWASGNGHRASGNGHRASGNGHQALGKGHRISGKGHRISGKGHRAMIRKSMPNPQFPMPNPQFPMPNPQFPIPNSQFPIPNSQCPIPNPQFPRPLLWAIAFGLSLGLGLMVKQTTLLFLLTPIVWVGFGALRQRHWGKLAQLLGALCLSVLVFGSWYRVNWLIVLTSGKRATVDSAIAEGDAPLNTLQAWTFYWHQLPHQVSLPLLLVPIFALLLYWGLSMGKGNGASGKGHRARGIGQGASGKGHRARGIGQGASGIGKKTNSQFPIPNAQCPMPNSQSLKWLAVFLLGAYLLSSLNPNKDERYVLPYLPTFSVFLAYGLTCFRSLWGKRIRCGTFGLAVLLMLFNLFPVGGVVGDWMTQTLSPNAQHYPDFKTELPHRQVIAQIIQTEPYLRSTLGVLPSTAKINQHNLNYYGALQDFQVYGRQVGVRKKFVEQDARSLEWFLTKTGKQGSVGKAQNAITQTVEQGGYFQLNKFWKLSDGNILKLYHKTTPSIEVKPTSPSEDQQVEETSQVPPFLRGATPVRRFPPLRGVAWVGGISQTKITLLQVTVPEKTPPGVPVPVTYHWNGSRKELQNGIVLLTWENSDNPKSKIQNPKWIHDHAIAMGNLYAGTNTPEGRLQVIERMAMLPPAEIAPGNYTLEAIYLNRVSGESFAIPVPKVTLQIDPQATPTPAPELDLLTQFRTLSAKLPQGRKALEQIFDEIGRINQYDPIQDYLVQVRQSLEYRLQHVAQNRDWAYALALTNVLQRRVNDAIASLQQVTKLDSENPYAWAYLAFVQLYNLQPAAAEKSLQPSLAQNPNLPEIQALKGVATLMQGKVIQAWQIFQKLEVKSSY